MEAASVESEPQNGRFRFNWTDNEDQNGSVRGLLWLKNPQTSAITSTQHMVMNFQSLGKFETSLWIIPLHMIM